MLRTRLYLGLMPLLLILIGTGAYAIRVSRELAGSLSHELVANYQAILALQQMRASATRMGTAVGDAQRGGLLEARKTFATARAQFTAQLMEQSAASAGTPRAPFVTSLDEAFQLYAQGTGRFLHDGGGGSLDDLQRNAASLYRVFDAIENLTRRDAASAQHAAAHAQDLAAATQRVLLAAIIAAVLLSLLVAWWLAAGLLRPITALTVSATALGDGQLDAPVPEFSHDELGRLARAFNTMAAKLRAYRDAMQARVLRTQRTMEATLTSTPDPLFVVSRDGQPDIRNPAAEALAHLPEFAGGFPPGIAGPLAEVLARGEHYHPTDYGRVITVRVGREERHYLPRILAIGDTLAEFRGAAVVLQDVTKFRLLDDAKTNLVGTVSHELKTPLTSLRMAVYLLLEQRPAGLTSTQQELLESARDDADRLLRMLDNLLDLSRLEAGVSALDLHPVAVAELLEGIAREARGFIEASGQTLTVNISDGNALAVLPVDIGRLRHVFMNLLTNAAKYSPPGGVIRLEAGAGPEGFLRFAVRDTGEGIPPGAAGHVFDRFYRAPGQTKTGAGLGLAIAREIVVAHGGSIACNSRVGEGTEFYFLLPIRTAASPA